MVIAPFKLARASLFRHLMFEIFEVEVLLFQRESEYKEATFYSCDDIVWSPTKGDKPRSTSRNIAAFALAGLNWSKRIGGHCPHDGPNKRCACGFGLPAGVFRWAMVRFEQTHSGRNARELRFVASGCVMFTSTECRDRAEQKLKQAERDTQHRRRLVRAAEAWLILADREERLETVSNGHRKPARARPRKRARKK